MSDQWARDHAAGLHQEEIVGLMEAMSQHYPGHSRAIILMACTRTIAAMLGPAEQSTREGYLRELVPMLQNMLVRIDELVEQMNADTQTGPL